jgi:hypothetical protein
MVSFQLGCYDTWPHRAANIQRIAGQEFSNGTTCHDGFHSQWRTPIKDSIRTIRMNGNRVFHHDDVRLTRFNRYVRLCSLPKSNAHNPEPSGRQVASAGLFRCDVSAIIGEAIQNPMLRSKVEIGAHSNTP